MIELDEAKLDIFSNVLYQKPKDAAELSSMKFISRIHAHIVETGLRNCDILERIENSKELILNEIVNKST